MTKQPINPLPVGAFEQALRQAVSMLQSGRMQEAEFLAADLLKRAPSQPRALQIYGYALLQQGKAKEAVAPLEQATQRSHDPEIATQYAMALYEADRSDEAIERFERLTGNERPYPPAFIIYGSLLTRLERRDAAIRLIKRGLALIPKHPELLTLLGENLLGRGERTDAIAALKEALVYAPKHADALFTLARELQVDGDFAQAAELFRRFLAVEPGGSAGHIGLGICLLELGEEQAAYESLRKAASISQKAFSETLAALLTSHRGRFWLRPSDAARFLRREN
jgi:tetratricopeptide (TPR) repeat protein